MQEIDMIRSAQRGCEILGHDWKRRDCPICGRSIKGSRPMLNHVFACAKKSRDHQDAWPDILAIVDARPNESLTTTILADMLAGRRDISRKNAYCAVSAWIIAQNGSIRNRRIAKTPRGKGHIIHPLSQTIPIP